MKLVKEHIDEKFTANSDPIKDMGIGIPHYKGFTPMFSLKQKFPGMTWPIGTIFGKQEGWGNCLVTYDKEGRQHGYTGWGLNEYFEPYVGKFFKRI